MVFEPQKNRFIMGYKKGVRIVSKSYLNFRSWLPTFTDKTTAPHRKAYTESLSGVGIATDVGAIVKLPSHRFKPPSSRIEDKISITPFRWTKVHHHKKLILRGCLCHLVCKICCKFSEKFYIMAYI